MNILNFCHRHCFIKPLKKPIHSFHYACPASVTMIVDLVRQEAKTKRESNGKLPLSMLALKCL